MDDSEPHPTRHISLREWLETLADQKARATVALIAGVLSALAYAAARFLIYWAFPVRSAEQILGVGVLSGSGHEWWVRDTIMDVPRLIAFGFAFWVGRYFWGLDGLGWHARRCKQGLIWGAIAACLICSDGLFRLKPTGYSVSVLAVVSLSSVVVALMEETLFRGLLFNALSDLGGRQWAIWVPTVLFTAYHVQAQPIAGWPFIFAAGLFLAVLRWQGVGLVWLVLSHAVGDSLIAAANYGPSRVTWWPAVARALQLGVPAVYFVWATRSWPSRLRIAFGRGAI